MVGQENGEQQLSMFVSHITITATQLKRIELEASEEINSCVASYHCFIKQLLCC